MLARLIHTTASTESLTNRTAPSARAAFTPPRWRLRAATISPLKQGALSVHGDFVETQYRVPFHSASSWSGTLELGVVLCV